MCRDGAGARAKAPFSFTPEHLLLMTLSISQAPRSTRRILPRPSPSGWGWKKAL